MEQRLALVVLGALLTAALLPMNKGAAITGPAPADVCPEVVCRDAWGAKPYKERDDITDPPVPFVILHHTYIPGFCNTSQECKQAMRTMQHMHQDIRGWFDIGYNFCIGGTGEIYEGRGWGAQGAHAPRYNDRSVGICFIGDFRFVLPTVEMMEAAKALIRCGVQENYVAEDYTLIGHRQVRETECPGDAFYENITTWPHYKNISDVQPVPSVVNVTQLQELDTPSPMPAML